jgi:aspartate 1-decarboxylase
MLRTMLKSKIHGATVTQTELTYAGSITIDRDLMDAVDLLDGEQVHIVNCNNGARIVTYVIEGDRGSGVICLNGPAARAAVTGDVVHILCYAQYDDAEARALKAQIAILKDGNTIAQLKP